MNYFPFHIGDYAVHTRHLSLMEDLAYRRLLDLYYTREKPLPVAFEEVARLVGMRDHVDEVEAVLCEFFQQDGEGWFHERCDAEIAKMQAKQDNARASVARRSANASVTQASSKRDASEIEASSTNTNTNTKQAELARERGKPRPARKAPDSFVVTPEMRKWATDNAPGVSVETETAKFLDHTFATSCIDWPGRWRNWLRKAPEFGSKTGETAYQRSMRERAAEMHPAIARAAPGIPKQNPMEVLDGLTVARIAG